MFFDSHSIKQDVMLRTEAKTLTNLHHIPPQIKCINVSASSTWWQKTYSNENIKNICTERQLLKLFKTMPAK